MSDQVTEAILHRIANGDILPGHSLPPHRELAVQLGVGLSVIREAIQRLQVLNVVRTRHGSGTVVEKLTWHQIALQPALHVLAMEPHLHSQISEARYAIERQTMCLATVRAMKQDIDEMAEIIGLAIPPPKSFSEHINLNTRFHLAIAKASKNTVLVDLLKPLLEISFTTVPEVFDEKAAKAAWHCHQLLLDAIVARDESKALEALDFHRSTAMIDIKKTKSFWLQAHTSARRRGRPKQA